MTDQYECRWCETRHDADVCPECGELNEDHPDYDPTPWCHVCGAGSRDRCSCPDPFYARNH